MSLPRALVLATLVLLSGLALGVALGVAGALEVVRDWWHDRQRGAA